MSEAEPVGGIHAVVSALENAPERVTRLQVARDPIEPRLAAVLSTAQQLGLAVERVGRERLDRVVDGLRHQGVIAWVRPRRRLGDADLSALVATGADLLLALDGVTDPHNLGACLRSAAAAGASALLIPRDRSASLTAAASKAAAGAAERVPVVSVTNLVRSLEALKQQGFWVRGLAGEASQMLYSADLTVPTVLVLGAEDRGLRPLTRACCDELLTIPMPGPMPSLNVSVAAGIALFEAVRQRSRADS